MPKGADISEEAKRELEKIATQVVAAYRPEKPRADSDLDLLIIKDTSERFIDRWTSVRRIVSEAEVQNSLDESREFIHHLNIAIK